MQKQDLTVGDRYCIDAVAMNAENMDAYLWVEGDTPDANRRFSDTEYTTVTRCLRLQPVKLDMEFVLQKQTWGKVLSSHFQYQK